MRKFKENNLKVFEEIANFGGILCKIYRVLGNISWNFCNAWRIIGNISRKFLLNIRGLLKSKACLVRMRSTLLRETWIAREINIWDSVHTDGSEHGTTIVRVYYASLHKLHIARIYVQHVSHDAINQWKMTYCAVMHELLNFLILTFSILFNFPVLLSDELELVNF